MRFRRSGRLEHSGHAATMAQSRTGPQADAAAAPLQSWRAWSGCGDGAQLHVVIDPAAGQVWLLPAEEAPIRARSIE